MQDANWAVPRLRCRIGKSRDPVENHVRRRPVSLQASGSEELGDALRDGHDLRSGGLASSLEPYLERVGHRGPQRRCTVRLAAHDPRIAVLRHPGHAREGVRGEPYQVRRHGGTRGVHDVGARREHPTHGRNQKAELTVRKPKRCDHPAPQRRTGVERVDIRDGSLLVGPRRCVGTARGPLGANETPHATANAAKRREQVGARVEQRDFRHAHLTSLGTNARRSGGHYLDREPRPLERRPYVGGSLSPGRGRRRVGVRDEDDLHAPLHGLLT